MSRLRVPAAGLRPADVAVLAYAAGSGALVAIGAAGIEGWPWLLAGRLVLVVGVFALARAAVRTPGVAATPGSAPALAHEAASSGHDPGGTTVTILQAVYPLLVCPLFFWEAPRLAEALWEGREWWMEAVLAGWDQALFGGPSIPAAFDLPDPAGEILWLFYFTYYPLVAAGLVLAWRGPRGRGGVRPSASYEPVMTAAVLGFLGAYALFPLLPARAPIHVVDAVAPASGGVFGAAVGWVQSWGGVTGSAFPSAHVSAAWAIVIALAPDRPRAASVLGVVAAGMTVACVYTPYHWAADVAAGLALGLVAGVAGRRLVPAATLTRPPAARRPRPGSPRPARSSRRPRSGRSTRAAGRP